MSDRNHLTFELSDKRTAEQQFNNIDLVALHPNFGRRHQKVDIM